MSALGQKQTCAAQKVMSAKCQKRPLCAFMIPWKADAEPRAVASVDAFEIN